MSVIVPIVSSLAVWDPSAGEFFEDLSARLNLSSSERSLLATDTSNLLRRCLDPENPQASNTTGLVTGYVQSGKTRSIESVISVARDNGYQMAIVLTGTSNALLVQSRGRLEKDLGIEDGVSELGWVSVHKPAMKDLDLVSGQLSTWRESTPNWERSSPLLFVLKNASNITKLAELLEHLNLENVPTLVVDDEADQASLDNNARRPKAKPTATYLSIEHLRRAVPKHSYIQYTATPQAPLLISISDSLSPDFVHVLMPGTDYTGGITFFGSKRNPDLVRSIDRMDLDVTHAVRVPATLKRAFRAFLLGVAAGLSTGQRPDPRNRSMFIHPSRNREPHEKYEAWVRFLKDEWASVLAQDPNDKERLGLMAEFTLSFEELVETASDLPSFETLAPFLASALSRLNIRVVNGTHMEDIRWKTAYAWVIIGGQSIDRGFTVEGLTVSYVPRPIGEGNADNFQQRARFFGYRQKFLYLCRVFMDDDSKHAFEKYVEHEELMRSELIGVQAKGTSLKEWKRVFMLDERFKPTRASVLRSGYFRTSLSGWLYPNWPQIEDGHVATNNKAIDALRSKIESEMEAYDEYPRHSRARVPLKDIVDSLWEMEFPSGPDSRRHSATMLALKSLLEEDPDATSSVFEMDRFTARVRSGRSKTDAINPMQGRNPSDASRYPGDEKIREGALVSVQLHNLTTVSVANGHKEGVYIAAIRLPDGVAKNFLVQP